MTDYLQLHEGGLTFSQIAQRHGVTRNVVAGAIYRARHPYVSRPLGLGGLRDEPRTVAAVALADAIGLCAAARQLRIDNGQLCRWRQILRAREAQQ